MEKKEQKIVRSIQHKGIEKVMRWGYDVFFFKVGHLIEYFVIVHAGTHTQKQHLCTCAHRHQ